MASPYETFETAPDDKPIAYVLVGLPGSGKTTWASRHPHQFPIASSARFIEDYAQENGLSFKEACKASAQDAGVNMKYQVERYIAAAVPFIWDQTNVSQKERLQIYAILSPTHRVVYVVFRVSLEECVRRNQERIDAGTAMITEAEIRKISASATFPTPGQEPFYKLISLTHPGWNEEQRKSA